MKPVYKCDYCSFMGTEEEVKEHEPKCTENYDMRSCYTCIHRGDVKVQNNGIKYECKAGKDVPWDSVYKHCNLYEKKVKGESPYSDILASMFGGRI